MKTAKPPAASAGEPSSSRRSQPVRQTRTNPSRTTGAVGRVPAHKDRAGGGAGNEQPIEIFPAITHFTDTITDLPPALARHFTLLKEVDAKVHAPEQALFRLIHEALALPPPDTSRALSDGAGSAAGGSAPMSAQNSSNGVPHNERQPTAPVAADGASYAGVFDPGNLPRRHLFRQIAFKIQEMLVSLEEKNHVIATANSELARRHGRIKGLWPALEQEFSEETRFGSSTHWAYAENRVARSNNAPADRSRRDGGAAHTPAAQPATEEAASRSDARKQAVAAKKEKAHKTHPTHESDMDDHDARHKNENGKKGASGAKSRKPAQAQTSEPAAPVGLGITAPSPVNGNPAPKRRKVEKNTNGGTPTERAMSSVFGSNAPKQKTTSPRETPAPENQSKKRKALPSSGNQAKKSRNGSANSPSVASSPVIPNFPEPVKVVRNSPVPLPPIATRAPTASRAKPVTPQQSAENGRPRPSGASSVANKPNGVLAVPTEAPAHTNGARSAANSSEIKPVKETPAAKQDVSKPEVVESTTAIPPPIIPPLVKKDPPPPVGMKTEDPAETRKDSPPVVPGAAAATGAGAEPGASAVSAPKKSGRASKPSTPAVGSFPDSARSRPARTTEGSTPAAAPKRSHKKGASIALAAAALAPNSPVGVNAKKAGEEETYCYCKGPSFGNMIACDAKGCPRQWFHLECLGLKTVPKTNEWFCKECKKRT